MLLDRRLLWFPTRNELDMRAELLFDAKTVGASFACTSRTRPSSCFVESAPFTHIQISGFVELTHISIAISRSKPYISPTSTPYISHSTWRWLCSTLIGTLTGGGISSTRTRSLSADGRIGTIIWDVKKVQRFSVDTLSTGGIFEHIAWRSVGMSIVSSTACGVNCCLLCWLICS